MRDFRTTVTIGLVSFATLVFELTQTRILSFIFWNHVVYLTVSVALMGFGVGGTLVAVAWRRIQRSESRAVRRLCQGFGLSAVLALLVTSNVVPLLRDQSIWMSMGLCYVVYTIPFLLAGALLSVLFTTSPGRIGILYCVDLMSASVACVAFFFLLPLLGAPGLVILLSTALIGLGLWWDESRGLREHIGVWATAVASGALLLLLCREPSTLEFSPISDKALGFMLLDPQARIEATVWHPLCRIDVVGDEKGRPAPYFFNPDGGYKIITQDAGATTLLPSRKAVQILSDRIHADLEGHTTTIAYRLRKQAEVGVIGVGGGLDVAVALAHGARSVFGIELNPATYGLARDTYRDYTGGFLDDPRVTVLNAEGRSALRSTDRQFDILQMVGIDTWAAQNAGAYVLSENYLYTGEAFEDIFARLKPDGIFSVHRVTEYPIRESLRLCALACEAWRQVGALDVDRRVLITKDKDGWATSLFKQSAFTLEEIETVGRYSLKFNRAVLYWPKILPPAAQHAFERQFPLLKDSRAREASLALNDLMRAYARGKEQRFFEDYPYRVHPTTDDSPFFFETQAKGNERSSKLGAFGQAPELALRLILIEATVLTIVAVFWPLWRYKRQGLKVPQSAAYSAYFAALGLGFMLVELSLVQKCVLFLGNPLYSLAVVLATLLVSAGLGSRATTWLGWPLSRITRVFGILLIALLAALVFGLLPLFYALLDLPFPARVLIVVVSVSLPGLLMGTFFPSGLQAIRDRAPEFVPWAWGINGCTSVYGSVLAIAIAIRFGFDAALVTGMLTYAIGFLVAQEIGRNAGTDAGVV